MRHEHLTVTVEAGTRERIEADLDGGETVEAWIADAIARKLDGEGEQDGGESDDGGADGNQPDDELDIDGMDDDEPVGGESDAEYEFVDDCGI